MLWIIQKKSLRPCCGLLPDLKKENLLLSGLIALIEHINSAGCINNFGFAGIERMRCV